MCICRKCIKKNPTQKIYSFYIANLCFPFFEKKFSLLLLFHCLMASSLFLSYCNSLLTLSILNKFKVNIFHAQYYCFAPEKYSTETVACGKNLEYRKSVRKTHVSLRQMWGAHENCNAQQHKRYENNHSERELREWREKMII